MLADEKVTDSSIINSAQSRVLNVFPDEAKRLDGRPWLPPHWAVSLPNTDKLDHRSAGSSEDLHKQFWLQSHLWRTPEWKCSNLLPSLGRIFGSLHHWKHNSSLALVQELIRIYPPALEMKDNSCNTPLYCSSGDQSLGLPSIACSAQLTPGQQGLSRGGSRDGSNPPGSIPGLLCMFQRISVGYPSILLEMIAEENMENLSVVTGYFDHGACGRGAQKSQELAIHTVSQSVRPELLMVNRRSMPAIL
eukprot:gene34754-44946_t